MPAPPVPQSQTAPTRDRDAYFAAAYELLVTHGCGGVTIAALCDRLGVTKGSFYHHFADMAEFVAAFAGGRLPFLGIVDSLERVLSEAPSFDEPGTVEEVLAAEAWARAHARTLVAAVTEGS